MGRARLPLEGSCPRSGLMRWTCRNYPTGNPTAALIRPCSPATLPRGGRLYLTFSITPKGRRRGLPSGGLIMGLLQLRPRGSRRQRRRRRFGCAPASAAAAAHAALLRLLCLGGLLVDLLADGVEGLLQVILLCLDVIDVAAGLQGFLQGVQLGLDIGSSRSADTLSPSSPRAFSVWNTIWSALLRISTLLAALLILGGILLGVLARPCRCRPCSCWWKR